MADRNSLLSGKMSHALAISFLVFALFVSLLAVQPAQAQNGTITIVKAVPTPTTQLFSFYAWGSNSGCCMPVQIEGSNVAPTNRHTWSLAAGTYSWEEDFNNPTPNPGWTVQSISCLPAGSATVDLPNRAFTANLAAGQNITCTYTNAPTTSQTGQITIVKAVPTPSTQLFNFYAFGSNSSCCIPVQVQGSNVAPSDQHTWTLAAGTYSWEEDFANPTPTTGWALQSISCLPAGSATVDLPNRAFTAHLAVGQHITCTYTNKPTQPQTGQITIVKSVPTPSTQLFNFYAFGSLSGCCMPVQIQGSNVAPTDQHTWTLAAGTYSWEEDFANPVPTVGWTLQSISCLPAGSATIDLTHRAFTAHLTAGQHITCTYANTPQTGRITIVKAVPTPTTQLFNFYAFGSLSGCCAPVQIQGSNAAPTNQHTWTLAAGTYSWEEDFANPTPTLGWAVQSISCLPAGSATVDLVNRAFTANLTAGQHITCT
ncbi:MAG: hypothetical protein WCE75_11350, partial [Terracidiphilus sp.]